ncbi:hypothetical protein [Actinomadura mexicana]|uniref:Uncharacterized protein n=1 Tax=Actinomadura mexicana TaxID=134959 RepID=A0A239HPI5_9ACTN|nr:hypothetical protein [Actinomadura mexicana]SNS83202.1 hypothetical protein SAMN06265355_13325 [Actinomadura mexicana]
MPLLTAAATHTANPSGMWLLFAILAAVGYLLHCVIWPYRACRKCDGAGRFRSPTGRAWRYCSRCGGKGAQLRAGRRIWTHLKNIDRNRR